MSQGYISQTDGNANKTLTKMRQTRNTIDGSDITMATTVKNSFRQTNVAHAPTFPE
jgi:hypothetical protein